MSRERADAIVGWLESCRLEHDSEEALRALVHNRVVPDGDGDMHGLLGIVNELLGWGRWRIAAVVSEDGEIQEFKVISVAEVYGGLEGS